MNNTEATNLIKKNLRERGIRKLHQKEDITQHLSDMLSEKGITFSVEYDEDSYTWKGTLAGSEKIAFESDEKHSLLFKMLLPVVRNNFDSDKEILRGSGIGPFIELRTLKRETKPFHPAEYVVSVPHVMRDGSVINNSSTLTFPVVVNVNNGVVNIDKKELERRGFADAYDPVYFSKNIVDAFVVDRDEDKDPDGESAHMPSFRRERYAVSEKKLPLADLARFRRYNSIDDRKMNLTSITLIDSSKKSFSQRYLPAFFDLDSGQTFLPAEMNKKDSDIYENINPDSAIFNEAPSPFVMPISEGCIVHSDFKEVGIKMGTIKNSHWNTLVKKAKEEHEASMKAEAGITSSPEMSGSEDPSTPGQKL